MAAALGAAWLLGACSAGGPRDTKVLQTQAGETGIQVTESVEDGTQVVRVTTTFRGQESTVVLAVDQPVYEVDIPLSIQQQGPAGQAGTAGQQPGAPGQPGAQGDFQELLLAQYLERAQSAMVDGNYNEALRQVNLVLLVRPDHVKAHEMKGSIYYAMGNFELANQEWEQVLALDPSNEEVRNFKDFLNVRQGAPEPAIPGAGATGAPQPGAPAPAAPADNPPPPPQLPEQAPTGGAGAN